MSNSDLKKEAEKELDLGYWEEIRLYGGLTALLSIWRRLNVSGNWRTTLLGIIAASLNQALVVIGNGTVVPQNSHDWVMLALSCAIAGMGFVMKDAAVGSQPGDPPTPARIAGAIESGAPLPAVDVAKGQQAEIAARVAKP